MPRRSKGKSNQESNQESNPERRNEFLESYNAAQAEATKNLTKEEIAEIKSLQQTLVSELKKSVELGQQSEKLSDDGNDALAMYQKLVNDGETKKTEEGRRRIDDYRDQTVLCLITAKANMAAARKSSDIAQAIMANSKVWRKIEKGEEMNLPGVVNGILNLRDGPFEKGRASEEGDEEEEEEEEENDHGLKVNRLFLLTILMMLTAVAADYIMCQVGHHLGFDLLLE